MSALMADHRDYADDERQPSLFDVLAPPSGRPRPDESERQTEGGRVVEFPRRRTAQDDAAATGATAVEGQAGAAPAAAVESAPVDAGVAEVPRAEDTAPASATGYLEPAPAMAPEDAWLTEIAPDLDEAELTMLAPSSTPVETEFAPQVDVTREPRTQRAAGLPLAGPTLDDVVSRVWEGLVMRLPAACPVCDGEVLPAQPGTHGGSCSSCGTTME